MNRSLLLIGIAALAPAAAHAAHVVNAGTRDWVAAAQTGRVDLLVIGDSMVWHQGNGWDAGYTQAAASTLGLAGTGLLLGGVGEGETFGVTGGSAWQISTSAMPAGAQGYAWRQRAYTAGGSQPGALGIGMSDSLLDSTAAYDMHVWTMPAPAATIGAYRRLGESPFTTRQTHAAEPIASSGPVHHVFNFGPVPADAGRQHEFLLQGTTNISILYMRLDQPGATGVAVTSWGYGGRSTRDFVTDQWDGQGVSDAGRTAWLNALVGGGSGKLNVLIAEGFNDRNEDQPSLAGTAVGDSPQAFEDNTRALIARIRDAWTTAGMDLSDLSFTLVSAYKDYWEGDGNGELYEFARRYEAIALGDPQVSFIDLHAMSLDWETANSMGYMADTTHASREGTIAYSGMVWGVLVPEPSSATLLGAVALLLRRRR